MIRSVSRPETLSSIRTAGYDLSDYQSEFVNQRVNRTLMLRQLTRPTLTGIDGFHSVTSPPKRSTLFSSENRDITLDNFVSAIHTHDLMKISNICHAISSDPQSCMNLLSQLPLTPEIVPVLMQAIDSDAPILYMHVLSTIFPYLKNLCETFIDEGLIFVLLTFFDSDNLDEVFAALTLFCTIAENSSYGVNSIICFEAHIAIIDCALTKLHSDVVSAVSLTLEKIFESIEDSDLGLLQECVPKLADLFKLGISTPAVLNAILQLTNRNYSISLMLFDFEIPLLVLKCLSNEETVVSALSLIRNFLIAKPSQVRSLVDEGLIGQLIIQIGLVEQAPLALEILGHLITVCPESISLLPQNFFADLIHWRKEEEFEVKRESARFLAVVILYIDRASLNNFIVFDIVDPIVEMLGCGVFSVVADCVKGLVRLMQYAEEQPSDTGLILLLDESDIEARIELDLSEQGQLKELLHHQLDSLRAGYTAR